jgi:hypothetical protein
VAIRKLKTVPEEMKKKVVECIRSVVLHHDDIIFSFIFGSFSDQEASDRYGDIDLAVYPLRTDFDGKSYIFEAILEEEIMERLSVNKLNSPPVEVINLKNAPYYFLADIFRQPYIMIKENEDAFTSLIDETSGRALANNILRKESIREILEGDKCLI